MAYQTENNNVQPVLPELMVIRKLETYISALLESKSDNLKAASSMPDCMMRVVVPPDRVRPANVKLNFQAVIKSAASAASPKTKIQESRGA